MALARYNATSGLLGGTRYGSENAEGTLGKAGLGKPRTTTGTQRTALGNISNRNAQSTLQAKKGLKESTNTKPSRVASKANAALKPAVAEKENATTNAATSKQETKPQKSEPGPCSPGPMDISAQGEAFIKRMLKVSDIDKEDRDNPQLVSEYVNDIYEYMRDLERKHPVNHHYLKDKEINGRMRGILIDWLVQVHLRFHLLQETLYLTVAIIDRFLQVQQVSRNKLQLVGVTSMLLASKYEEMYAPEIADFVYITDNAYTKSDIRKMECVILKTLDFNLGRPLPLHFLRRNSKAGEVDATKHTLAKYLMELTIVDYEACHFHPSQVAAAALCLSIRLLDNADWSDNLTFYSKYEATDLLPIMQRMAGLVLRASAGKLTAVKTKYQSSKFMKISVIPELQSQCIQDMAQAAES